MKTIIEKIMIKSAIFVFLVNLFLMNAQKAKTLGARLQLLFVRIIKILIGIDHYVENSVNQLVICGKIALYFVIQLVQFACLYIIPAQINSTTFVM